MLAEKHLGLYIFLKPCSRVCVCVCHFRNIYVVKAKTLLKILKLKACVSIRWLVLKGKHNSYT